MKAAKTREQMEAELTAYQDSPRTGRTARPGPPTMRPSRIPLRGIGAHEIDAGKRIVRVNSQELRMLGYRADQMLGRVASDFVVLQDFSQHAMNRKLSGAALTPYVRAFKKRTGHAPCSSSIVPFAMRRDRSSGSGR